MLTIFVSTIFITLFLSETEDQGAEKYSEVADVFENCNSLTISSGLEE